jgi:hypothetical protein
VKPHFPYHVAFEMHVGYSKYTINRIVVDEGTATCVMSLVCWRALGFPTLSRSPTMLTYFDSRSFHPHDILPAFPVHLGWNTIEVDVKVVDAPLDYNILLGHNWNYAMTAIVLFLFRTLCFHHDGKIVTIDQLTFTYVSPSASIGPSIPMVDTSQPIIENIIARMIHPIWVPLTSWHQFTIFTLCQVGLFC